MLGVDRAMARAIEEHIQADARWVAWIAGRLGMLGADTRPAPLHASGTTEADPARQVHRLGQALMDLRRRRLNPHAPHGWPVLSLHQRSLLVTSHAAATGGRLFLHGSEAHELARLLLLLRELARVEWAEPMPVGGSAVAGARGRGR